jgi:hypothetical protein
MQMQFRVRLDEILPTKQAARTLPQELNRLERGEVEQLVLTTRSNPRAVIVSVDRFDELMRRESQMMGGDQLAA